MSNMNTQTPQSDLPTVPSKSSLEPVKQQAQNIGHEINELGRVSSAVAKQELAAAKQAGTEAVEHAKEKVEAWEDSLIRSVRNEPLKSLAYAAGAGLLFGFFSRR